MNNASHYLKPDWPAPNGVHAATTLRTGGFSSSPFASLNPALHVGDKPENVEQNRTLIKTQLNLPSEPFWLQQTHSTHVVEACSANITPTADASFTRAIGVVCVVLTADCLPVLVCAEDGSTVAAIHAGWRGLQAGIISKTLAALPQKKYWVWLGPAIGANCFEVGADVYSAFVTKSNENLKAFKAQSEEKWLADIYKLAKIELLELGMAEDTIYGGHYCTMTEIDRFYSFRRDGQTGRMASMIWRSK